LRYWFFKKKKFEKLISTCKLIPDAFFPVRFCFLATEKKFSAEFAHFTFNQKQMEYSWTFA